jgi:very-short-patch-repair endonuclease
MEIGACVAARGDEVSIVHADRAIGERATQQDGLITWAQLRALGLGRGAIEHRVNRGLLRRVHVGVYAWGAAADSPWLRGRAAVLACGKGTFASHRAALGLREMAPHPDGPVDVTVVGRRVRRCAIRVHPVAAVHRHDVSEVRGIWVSSPARALLEVAAELSADELAEVVERAQVKRIVTKRQLEAVLDRAAGRPGAPALRALVDEPAFTRSKAERLVVALVRAARLPEPAFNAMAEGFEVDVLWRRERVVLEFDSYEFHATRAAFERDRRRTAALTRAGYVVLRATWTELTRESHALVARTAEALARHTAASNEEIHRAERPAR